MITLHRLSTRSEIVLVNPDLIERVEACPDTVLRMADGSLLRVTETPDEVTSVILAWRSQVMSGAVAAAA